MKKLVYETPSTEVVEVRMERTILSEVLTAPGFYLRDYEEEDA